MILKWWMYGILFVGFVAFSMSYLYIAIVEDSLRYLLGYAVFNIFSIVFGYITMHELKESL